MGPNPCYITEWGTGFHIGVYVYRVCVCVGGGCQCTCLCEDTCECTWAMLKTNRAMQLRDSMLGSGDNLS